MLSLNELGYDVTAQGDVFSDKYVVIKLGLPHDKLDEKTKKEVQQFATDIIKKIILILKYSNLT